MALLTSSILAALMTLTGAIPAPQAPTATGPGTSFHVTDFTFSAANPAPLWALKVSTITIDGSSSGTAQCSGGTSTQAWLDCTAIPNGQFQASLYTPGDPFSGTQPSTLRVRYFFLPPSSSETEWYGEKNDVYPIGSYQQTSQTFDVAIEVGGETHTVTTTPEPVGEDSPSITPQTANPGKGPVFCPAPVPQPPAE